MNNPHKNKHTGSQVNSAERYSEGHYVMLTPSMSKEFMKRVKEAGMTRSSYTRMLIEADLEDY